MRKTPRNALGRLGIAVAASMPALMLSTPALADLIGFEYRAKNSAMSTTPASAPYINPEDDITIYVASGLDRRVEVSIKNSAGQIVQSKQSGVLGGSDRFTFGSSSYYGYAAKFEPLSDGSYTIETRVLNTNGSLVREGSKSLVVDTTAPSVGSFSWSMNYGGGTAADGIPLWSRVESKHITLSGVADSLSGISSVTYRTISDESSTRGNVITSGSMDFIAASNKAMLGSGTVWTGAEHAIANARGKTLLEVSVKDKAGNVTVTSMAFYNNSSCGPKPELYAIEDSSSNAPSIGLTGFRVVGGASTTPINKNPLKAVYRVAKSDYRGLPEGALYGGFPVGITSHGLVHTDNDYAYFMVEGPLGIDATFNFPTFGWTNHSTWRCNAFTVNSPEFSDMAKPPKWVNMEAHIDGVGWVGPTYGAPGQTPKPPRDTKVSALRGTVEPRAYAQTFSYLGGSCEIPAWGDQCTFAVDRAFNTTGTASHIHDRPPLRAVNNTGLYSQYNTLVWEWDASDPYVTQMISHDTAKRQVVFEGVELHSGNSWGRVTMKAGGLVARDGAGGEHVVAATEMVTQGNNSVFTASYDSIPEGNFKINAWVRDNYGNYGEKHLFDVMNDATAPLITLSVPDATAVASLDDIEITVSDGVSSAPVIDKVSLTGGPTGENVQLTVRKVGNNTYKLEYPIMFPSQAAGEEYVLSVTAKDDQQNSVTESLTFSYTPRTINLIGDTGEGISVPAASHEFVRQDGMHIIATEPLTLSDGDVVSGSYDVYATLRSDSEIPLTINGARVEPGATVTVLSKYNFAENDGRLNIPLMVSDVGEASLVVSTTAPNAPIALAKISGWKPNVQLKAGSWSVYPALEEVSIGADVQGSKCSKVVSSVEKARDEGHPLTEPICLLEWGDFPRELYAASNESQEPILTGYTASVGENPITARISLVTKSNHKVRLETTEGVLNVMLPDGSIKTRLNPEVPSVERVLQYLSFNIEQEDGPRCSIITMDEEEALNEAGRGRPSCLLTWTNIPDGLIQSQFQRKSPRLEGFLDYRQGDIATMAWTIDAFTPAGQKVPMGTYTHDLTIIDPPLPEITVESKKSIGADLYYLAQSGGALGDYLIESRPAEVQVRETYRNEVVGEAALPPGLSNVSRSIRRINLGPAPLWSYNDFTIDSKYTALPDLPSSKTIRVLSVPDESIKPIVEVAETTVLNTGNLDVSVKIQNPFNTEQAYDAATMGEWEVRLVNYLSLSRQTPMTEFQAIRADGSATFSLDTKSVDAEGFRLAAEARLISPEPLYQRQVLSPRPVYITVLRGEAIAGDVKGQRLSGRAPLTIMGVIELENRLDQEAIGSVAWESRAKGATEWVTVEDPGRVVGRITKTFEAGRYDLRARITNANSGAEFTTETIDIHAYNVPDVNLEGPWNVFIGDDAVYTVKAKLNGADVPADQLEILWSQDDGATWEKGGDSLTLTRSEDTRVTLRTRTRLLSADNSQDDAWVESRGRISFRQVLPPRASIVGPRMVEVGTEQEWRGLLQTPFRDMAVEQKGYFLMPDGTRVDSETVRYTPTEADLANGQVVIRYVNWIDGFPETENVVERSILVWVYEWPKWEFNTRLTAMEAPATATMRVRSPSGRARYIEGLKFEWKLPEGAEVIAAESSDVRVLAFKDPGEYQVEVGITDDRGNATTLTETVIMDEQTPWVADYRLSYSNSHMRAPLKIDFRPLVSGGHPHDRVESFSYLLDDQVVAENVRYGSVEVPEGEHAISMRFTTAFGHIVEKKERITVKPNVPPVCTVTSREYDSSWRLLASCTDSDGVIARHNWRVNGEAVGLTGSRISLSRGDAKPEVILVGVDDAGGESQPVKW